MFYDCLLLTLLATYRFVDSCLSGRCLAMDILCVTLDLNCVSEAIPAPAEVLFVLKYAFRVSVCVCLSPLSEDGYLCRPSLMYIQRFCKLGFFLKCFHYIK